MSELWYELRQPRIYFWLVAIAALLCKIFVDTHLWEVTTR